MSIIDVTNKILCNLPEVFPEPFQIKTNIKNTCVIISIHENQSNDECLSVAIFEDLSNENIFRVSISEIKKCSLMSATRMIQNLELIICTHVQEIKQIGINDASHVLLFNNEKYLIELWVLKILSKGESWYNSLGYYQRENREKDRENNSKLQSQTNITEILSQISHTSYFDNHSTPVSGANRAIIGCINELALFFMEKESIETVQEFYDIIQLTNRMILKYFPSINLLTVKEIFNSIDSASTDEEKLCYYTIVALITPHVKYYPLLSKMVN